MKSIFQCVASASLIAVSLVACGNPATSNGLSDLSGTWNMTSEISNPNGSSSVYTYKAKITIKLIDGAGANRYACSYTDNSETMNVLDIGSSCYIAPYGSGPNNTDSTPKKYDFMLYDDYGYINWMDFTVNGDTASGVWGWRGSKQPVSFTMTRIAP